VLQKYLGAVMPLLIAALQNIEAENLCTYAVGAVTDICAAVQGAIQPYCDEIMKAFKSILQDSNASRELKPVVLSCFGDIAMAIGAAYEPYLQISVMLLMQAASTPAPADDEDLLALVNQVRLSVIEAYSGIIIGLSDGNALQLMVPHLPAVFQFLQYLATPGSNKDDDVTVKAVTLIGDIAQRMGSNPTIRQQLTQPFVSQLFQEAAMTDPSNGHTVQWAHALVQLIVQQ
jgi:importin subunit beta-1